MKRRLFALLLIVVCSVATRADASERKKMKADWPDGGIVLKFPDGWRASCISIVSRDPATNPDGWYCNVGPSDGDSDVRVTIRHASGIRGDINE